MLHGKFDHHARQRVGVVRDGENLFVRHRLRFFSEQLPALRNRDGFRFRFHTIEYVHGRILLNASRDDSCWMDGALGHMGSMPRVMSADAGLRPA